MKTTIKQRYNLVARGYFCTFLEMLKVLHPSCGVGTAYFCTETRGHKVLRSLKAPLLLAGEGCGSCLIGLTATGEVRTQNAFTLAETLITLGVIGVVAAVTLPTLLTNIQDRVRQEQVRTVKYKFTKATEKMNSLGLIGHYDSTMDFVNELKKHMTISKVCDSSKLNECWGYTSFTNANASTTYTVAELKTGKSLEALQFNSGDTDTVGIVTGDGVPIILTYGKECQALDESKQYQWSTVNGKPETNATAGCVSMVFDINGPKAPNKIGTDVRTMNSLLGRIYLGNYYTPITQEECYSLKDKFALTGCYVATEYWVAGLKKCDDLGLQLPSLATLAKIATVQYGVPVDINESVEIREDCSGYDNPNYNCKVKPEQYSSPLQTNFNGLFWSREELHNVGNNVFARAFRESYTFSYNDGRHYGYLHALCVAD